MTRDCGQIRRRALEHGKGSPEYDVWVHHSLHCPECRSEVYVQELLCEDGRAMRGTLSSESVSRLVQLAETRYRGGHHRKFRIAARAWSWGWRCAVVCVVVYAMTLFSPGRLGHGDMDSALAGERQPLATGMGQSSPVGVATAGMSTSGNFSSGNVEEMNDMGDGVEAMSTTVVLGRNVCTSPETLSVWEVENAIQDCRKRIDGRREHLFERLENDAAGRP